MGVEASSDQLFPLFQCWESAFESLRESLGQMVRQRDLSPRELASVAKLIYAIERLPNSTDGVAIEASTTLSSSRGRNSLVLCHYGHSIGLTYRTVFYEPQGTEHTDICVLEAEVGVGNNREGHDPITVLTELEDWINEWTNRICSRDCEFQIIDEDYEMDWDQPMHHQGWAALPSGV